MLDLLPLNSGPPAALLGQSILDRLSMRSPLPSFVASAFRTRQADDPPQTVRTCGIVLHPADRPDILPAQQSLPSDSLPAPGNCARGKVAVLLPAGRAGCVACYQVSAESDEIALTACGNTTAAAAALQSRLTGFRRLALEVELADRSSVLVETNVSRLAGGVRFVEQTWNGVAFQLSAQRRVGGRWCAACLGPLNNYLVVRIGPDEDVNGFTLAEAIALWQQFDLDRQPLLARLAVVQPACQPAARVRFFTCGEREHPSAPLTGLAVLALVARQVDWLELPPGGCVLTKTGLMATPRICACTLDSFDMRFPAVAVALGG